MDWAGLSALLLALGTLGWIGWDKAQAAKSTSGQYAENLAATAQKLVDISQDIYEGQLSDMKEQLAQLQSKVEMLERELFKYRSCPLSDCPVRAREQG